jgi:hypothetical protein
MSKGGAIKPVVVITDADLRENGGRYKLRGGAARPVSVINLADIGARLE